MRYKDGYKYQLHMDEQWRTNFRPLHTIDTKFIRLNTEGWLTVKAGYAWDGTSGPVIDRDTNQTASLIHDALYQLMRERHLSHTKWRKADIEFGRRMKLAGAWSVTINIDLLGLRIAGGKAAHPSNRKKIRSVP